MFSPLHHPPLFAPCGGDLRCHCSWGPGPLVWDWLAYQVWLAECAVSDNVTTTVIIMASKLSSANFCLRQSGAKLGEHTILFPASSVWLLDFCSSHKAGKSNWQEQRQAWELKIVYAWGFQLSLVQKIVHTNIVLSNGVLCCHQSRCPQITFEHDQNMLQSMYVPLVQDLISYSTLTSFLSLCLASKIKHKVIPSWSSLKFSVTLSTYNKSTQIY